MFLKRTFIVQLQFPKPSNEGLNRLTAYAFPSLPLLLLHGTIATYLYQTFSTQTVVQTESDTRIIVKSRYLPSSGTASDVGGMISASSKKNTVNDTSIEMQSVTYREPG